jgi:uncharacterized integral membrane protein
MKYLTLLLILICSLVLLCFLYLNQGLVTITWFPGGGYQTPPVPLFAVIMLSVIAGVLMAGLIGMTEQLRLRVRNRQLTKRADRLERELDALRPADAAPGPTEPSPPELPSETETPQLSS